MLALRLRTCMILLGVSSPLLGQQTQYDYPELLVSPRASERLAEESKAEKGNRWFVNATTQAPALLNLFTGLRAMNEGPEAGGNDEDAENINNAGLMSTAIGAGWLGLTAGLSLWYSPYHADYRIVKKLPSKNKRLKLNRERRAEEALEDAANFGKRLNYIGAALNLGAAAAVLGSTNDSQTRIQAAMSAGACILPLIFDHPWVKTYEKHRDYKKKIYAPLVRMEYTPSLQQGELAPALSFSWKFI